MKIAVLWTKPSGYLNSCLRALAALQGVELFVAYQAPTSDAPFANEQFSWFPKSYRYSAAPDAIELLPLLRSFGPDVLISSWHLAGYRAACREFRNRAVRVCCMDHQWEGTPKQWLGVATSPVFVQRLFDAAFVAGERQSTFAQKLGFNQDQIWRGLYSCDHAAFTAAYEGRLLRKSPLPRSFLYVGRLSPEKGIDSLLDAYRRYQAERSAPWPLAVAGEGALRGELENVAGVKLIGFVQPDQLPETFSQAGCLVVPSHWEPWGLVIHEACTVGLPVICTSACGAAVHLVQDGYNGFITETGDPQSLALAFRRFTELDEKRRGAMGEASHLLSLQFTPERWANCVHDRGLEMLSGRLPQERSN
jgi:glycosyltransferase involved in cell wall biosynthesis